MPPTQRTQRGVRGRAYCFTANVAAAIDEAQLRAECERRQQDPGFRYLCFQLEIAPTTLQLHYQGYVHFGEKRDFRPAKACIEGIFDVAPHIELARGTAADNREYCKKPGSRVEGSFVEFGTFPAQGRRTDLARVAQAVIEGKSLATVAADYPTEFIRYHGGIKCFQAVTQAKPRDMRVVPSVFWWFGPTGVGKSRRAFDLYGDAAYVKMNNAWWDGYTGQDVVIIDDYRPSLCTFQELLRIIDRYPMRVQIKGSSSELSATKFVFTTTSRPEVLWAGRTEEAMNQLLRRITEITEFKPDGSMVVLKDANVNYVPLLQPAILPTLNLVRT